MKLVSRPCARPLTPSTRASTPISDNAQIDPASHTGDPVSEWLLSQLLEARKTNDELRQEITTSRRSLRGSQFGRTMHGRIRKANARTQTTGMNKNKDRYVYNAAPKSKMGE